MRYYFAFGSNMKRTRLVDRLGEVTNYGIATLKDYCIVFNKYSTLDSTGKTNIIPAKQQDVLGVLYGLSEDQLKKLDGAEGGYFRIPIEVQFGADTIKVQTYVAKEGSIRDDLLPTAEYLDHLIDGAKEYNFPEEYQTLLRSFEICK